MPAWPCAAMSGAWSRGHVSRRVWRILRQLECAAKECLEERWRVPVSSPLRRDCRQRWSCSDRCQGRGVRMRFSPVFDRSILLGGARMLLDDCRHASGTPLSVLDPAGYPTVEQTYKNIEDKLKVRFCAVRCAAAACVSCLGCSCVRSRGRACCSCAAFGPRAAHGRNVRSSSACVWC